MSNQLRLICAEAIGVLCDCSTQVDNYTRERIERVVSDWCKETGWSYSVTLQKIEVYPPAIEDY